MCSSRHDGWVDTAMIDESEKITMKKLQNEKRCAIKQRRERMCTKGGNMSDDNDLFEISIS